MNLVSRKNIIDATLKVNDMSSEQIQTLILDLLDKNPTIVLRALGVEEASKRFKVVLINHGPNKINVIKTFRELTGAGLADAKGWSEGGSYNDLPSGVFGQNLTKTDAETFLVRVNDSLNGAGVKAEIVAQETTVKALPYTWNPLN